MGNRKAPAERPDIRIVAAERPGIRIAAAESCKQR